MKKMIILSRVVMVMLFIINFVVFYMFNYLGYVLSLVWLFTLAFVTGLVLFNNPTEQ